MDLDLLAANRRTEICSVYIAPDEIEKSLRANADDIRDLAQIVHAADPGEILLVGSGASYCALYAGYYFLKTSSRLRTTLSYGPELLGDKPPGLGDSRPFAVLASYSGKTADTVEASQYLERLDIPRLAISRDQSGPLARGCDSVLAYRSNCLFTSAMANLLQLLAEVLELRGETGPARAMKEALLRLPDQMRRSLAKSDDRAQAALARLGDRDLIYVLGDGALWGLTYQYGYTNLMEYARVHSSCMRSSEWRHGPLELLFREPSMLLLLGNDGTRGRGEAARDYCARRGANLVTFDVVDYFDTLPALSPFVLHSVTQLLLLYLCTQAGIDMDEYLEMHTHQYVLGETYF